MIATLLVLALHVTRAEYDAVHPGQTRAHVQSSFGGSGHRVGLYYGGRGWAHLWKNYRTNDGQWAHIYYSHGPQQHVFQVAKNHPKGWCASYHDPCTGVAL